MWRWWGNFVALGWICCFVYIDCMTINDSIICLLLITMIIDLFIILIFIVWKFLIIKTGIIHEIRLVPTLLHSIGFRAFRRLIKILFSRHELLFHRREFFSFQKSFCGFITFLWRFPFVNLIFLVPRIEKLIIAEVTCLVGNVPSWYVEIFHLPNW